MLLTFNITDATLSHGVILRRRENFPRHAFQIFPAIAATRRSFNAVCSLATPPTDLIGKIKEKFNGKNDNPLAAAAAIQSVANIPSSLCIIDTVQRLGVDRYFQSEIDSILEETYRSWREKDSEIYSDVTTHAMAFRLLRVKGYEVSSEELAPYAEQERVDLLRGTIDVSTVIELYRAAQERISEEESSLEKLLGWTTTFLKQQLLTNSIPDNKLHKQVEYYLKNYHGILDRMGVRRNLDLYDISHYRSLRARFPNLCNEEFLSFARQDFNMCQAQHREDLEQLQRWYSDCRLDTLKFGRNVLRVANFLTSAIIGDPELSEVRIVFAQHIILVTLIDDLFDHGGTKQESYKILELVKEWKEKSAAEYGCEEVEILFTAVYNTVNEVVERADVAQGRSVKDFLIKLWVQILSIFKIELDTWSDETELSLDEYLSNSWVSIGCRICILMSMQFMGIKLTDEMLLSEECIDLCRHVSMVDRLLNDVQTFEKERKENTGNSVSLLLAANKDDSAFTEEEAITKAKEMAEWNRRQLMNIVYIKGNKFPRKCRDMFLKVCRIGCYLYASGDEFTSPQQMMEDMKSLVYEPVGE